MCQRCTPTLSSVLFYTGHCQYPELRAPENKPSSQQYIVFSKQFEIQGMDDKILALAHKTPKLIDLDKLSFSISVFMQPMQFASASTAFMGMPVFLRSDISTQMPPFRFRQKPGRIEIADDAYQSAIATWLHVTNLEGKPRHPGRSGQKRHRELSNIRMSPTCSRLGATSCRPMRSNPWYHEFTSAHSS